MSVFKRTRGHAPLASRLRNVAKRALYLAILLLPGSLIVLPVLWWFDRHRARNPLPEPDNERGVANREQSSSRPGGFAVLGLSRCGRSRPLDASMCVRGLDGASYRRRLCNIGNRIL